MDAVIRIDLTQPTDAQKEAGNYRKRKVQWAGLTISIENEAGTFRRGRSRTGHEWEHLLRFAYGYVNGSMGVDGDQVDVYLGPNLDAPFVYVIHQRQFGNWSEYDEDKCMIGFESESDAADAFLSNYNDPRFLGEMTTMPVADFVAKVRATKEAPAMIKSKPIVLIAKSYVGNYIRRGVMVSGYQNKHTPAARAQEAQRSLFPSLPESRKPEPKRAVVEKPKENAASTDKHDSGKEAPKKEAPKMEAAKDYRNEPGFYADDEMHEVEIQAGQTWRGTKYYEPRKFWMSPELANVTVETHGIGKRTGRAKIGDREMPLGADGRAYDAAAVAARRKAAGKGTGKRWGANKNKDDWKKIGDAVYGDRK